MQVLNIFHVLIAIALVGFILIQKGQGATAGAAFGSGASGTVFGARGAGNFLSRTTWVLAALFCTLSLVMAVMVSRMSAQPENDLGVVSSSQVQDQLQRAPVIENDLSGNTVNENEITVGADDSGQSDLPLTGVGSDAVDRNGMHNSSADDLPVLDAEAIKSEITEEARAVIDGTEGEGPDKDGS